MKKIRHLLVALLLLVSTLTYAQVTTSSMSGKVTDGKESLIGATVKVTHAPSGTNYGAVTNAEGRFSIQGMRTGGPYKVEIIYLGFGDFTQDNIYLQLGETYTLNAQLKEEEQTLDEVVISASNSKFTTEKTGATTNISSSQIEKLPTINRSISDIARLSPYANSMGFAGGDGRSTNFTIDGANFNNNFGLTSILPGGGTPISIDAIEEIQAVVAPFDVRQTNFIGGGINAITKSGTNTFKGTAYTYFRNQETRGNRIDGKDLGARPEESKKTYGFTLGGPILKNKLFFFVNYEKEIMPGEVIKYRAREDNETATGMVSRTKLSDMKRVYDHLKSKYGYDAGSYTDFPADETNEKILARIDWNITDRHHLALRYNNTKNVKWIEPNGTSMDGGSRTTDNRVGPKSMAFANSMYSMDNNVWSISADLNSRFGNNMSNQLLFTHTNIEDIRGSNSSLFPFIDILYEGVLEPYISAGYELFTYNNGVKNQITSVIDNFTYYLGNQKITAGVSFEHQFANNAYMRNGTGYYRYKSIDDFLNGATPETFALTYGWNGEANPNAQITFNQFGVYLQDEWDVTAKLKLTGGIRFDNIMYDNKDLLRNDAIYALDFGGKHIDTGKWPDSNIQISPRLGFVYDVFDDKTFKVRGGTGVFTGRLPLVFLTNMPTNSNMVQNAYATQDPAQLAKLQGGLITDVNQMISTLGLPTTLATHVASTKLSGVAEDFKMPQIWKSSVAVDYKIPTSFPFTVTGEFIYNKNVNAVTMNNINIKDNANWQRFNGADNRVIYPANRADWQYISGTNAVVLENTNKGYGYIANITLNAQPVDNLDLMLAYTLTESKELSGLPGNDPVSTWQGLQSIDGPNFPTLQRSQYVIPNKVIASVNYFIPFTHGNLLRGTHLNLFYSGYTSQGFSYANSYIYTNDMNGDGIAQDLMYIPKDDSEIKFKTEEDKVAFWNFVEQDSYLKNHKGQYAEAYSARTPWVHKFDFRLAEDFEFKVGGTKQKFQLSFDFINIGNMFNSKWGVAQTNSASNSNKILTFDKAATTANNNVPVFSMYKINGEYPTKTYTPYMSYGECWKLQLGLKYFFN